MKLLANNIYKNFHNNQKLSKILLKPKGLSIAKSDKIQPKNHDQKFVKESIFLNRSGK